MTRGANALKIIDFPVQETTYRQVRKTKIKHVDLTDLIPGMVITYIACDYLFTFTFGISITSIFMQII